MTFLTRRYRFSASHRLHSPELTPSENARLFGKCNNPFGHGHDYLLEVTVSGLIDPATGLLVSVPTLDRLVSAEVLSLFSHRNINLEVPQFSALIPTTENVALVITDILKQRWLSYFSPSVRLHRIHVQETARNGFEVVLPVSSSVPSQAAERVSVHA